MKTVSAKPSRLSPDARRKLALEAALKEACKLLDLDTLETRRSDSLDFHDVAVWTIKSALEHAFEAGRKSR